jgi:hypothetical protein
MSLVSTILADAPTAFYEMQETTGTIAHDASGNGFDASINGGVTLAASGPSPYTSFTFNGTTGYLDVPPAVSFNNATAFSVEFAFNQLIAGGGTARVIASSHTDATSKGFQAALNEGTNSGGLFDIGHNGTNEYANFWPGAYTLATWHHIIYVMDSSSNKLLVYLDGVLANSGATFPGGTTVTNDTFDINIGRGPYNNDYYRGGLAMAALYNGVALTQAKVTAHYLAFINAIQAAASVGGAGGAQAFGSSISSNTAIVGGAGGVKASTLGLPTAATTLVARDGKTTLTGRDGKTTMIAR